MVKLWGSGFSHQRRKCGKNMLVALVHSVLFRLVDMMNSKHILEVLQVAQAALVEMP